MNDIADKLDELAQLRGVAANIRSEYEVKRTAILAKVANELKVLDNEYESKTANADSIALQLEVQIKELVVELGVSVKGRYLHAVWAHGRVKWDGKALEGYAAAHQEILKFRNEGDPSVAIKAVK